jgi:hypothetical protein
MSLALVVTGLWLSTAPSMEPNSSPSKDKTEGGVSQSMSFTNGGLQYLSSLLDVIARKQISDEEQITNERLQYLLSLTNLRPISSLENLKKLDWTRCGQITNERLQYLLSLTNLRPISSLTNLWELNLRGCPSITNLEGLSNLSNLKDVKRDTDIG